MKYYRLHVRLDSGGVAKQKLDELCSRTGLTCSDLIRVLLYHADTIFERSDIKNEVLKLQLQSQRQSQESGYRDKTRNFV